MQFSQKTLYSNHLTLFYYKNKMTPNWLNPDTMDYIMELTKTIQALSLTIEGIESELKKVKNTLSTLATLKDNIGNIDSIIETSKKWLSSSQSTNQHDDHKNIIEWIFDWYFMVGDDLKKYPVPVNYSSKSKLVPWDRLKVTIKDNGELMYKLILPAERKHIRAVLSRDNKDYSKFYAIASDSQTYTLNTAAISFFKWLPGDEIYITINKDGKGSYAALEAVIKSWS